MKKGIIILLYSIGLVGVLSLILISTYEPQNFTVEIGKSQKELIKLTEISQNYQTFVEDSANYAAYDSRFYSGNDFETNFVLEFEERMNEYPKFYKDFTIFEYSVNMDYTFEFDDETNLVKVSGFPLKIVDSKIYLSSDDVIFEGEEELIRSYILINSSIINFKFYPNFELYSEYNVANIEENNEEGNI